MNRIKCFLIVLVLLCSSATYAAKPNDWKEPKYIKVIITAAEKAYGVPPGLGHCLAYRESRFNTVALSKMVKGFKSVGLFQLYWKYMYELVVKHTDIPLNEFNWKNPKHSAKVGCSYLAYLINRFDSEYLGIVAYNYGPGNTSKIKSIEDVPPDIIDYANDIYGLWQEWDPSW